MMTDEREVRQTMAAGLVSAAAKDDRIVVLDADLMSCHSTKCFLEAYPERFINVGIAEANLIGVAAGMAAFGKIPFAFSFAPFATRRCYDQIFISVAYSKLPVKIVGSDPGVMAEANGGTHMPFEDMSIMRAIPHMVCFEPTDATMLEKALPEIIDYPGAVYIRMFRKKAEKIYDDSLEFKLGKAVTLKDGGDVTLIASGIMVARALKAADELKEAGIDARVLKPHRRGRDRVRGEGHRRDSHLREPHHRRRPRQRGRRSGGGEVPRPHGVRGRQEQLRRSRQRGVPLREIRAHRLRHRRGGEESGREKVTFP